MVKANKHLSTYEVDAGRLKLAPNPFACGKDGWCTTGGTTRRVAARSRRWCSRRWVCYTVLPTVLLDRHLLPLFTSFYIYYLLAFTFTIYWLRSVRED